MKKKSLSFYMISAGLLTLCLLVLQAAANLSQPVFYGLIAVYAVLIVVASARLKSDLLDYFKSMKLAAALLIYITLAVAIGTMVLQNVDQARYLESYSEKFYQFIKLFTLEDTYHSIWFGGLVALLNINLLFCTLDKLPLKKSRVGFFLIHLSILIVVIGGSMSAFFGIKGYIHMNEGNSYDSFRLTQYNQMLKESEELDFSVRLDDFEVEYYDPDYRVYVYAREDTQEEFDSAPFSFKAQPGESYRVDLPGSDAELDVDGFYHHYAVREVAVESEDGVPAAEVVFSQGEQSQTAHFFDQPGDDRFFLPRQEGMIVFKQTMPENPAEAVEAGMILNIQQPDGSIRELTVQAGQIYPFVDNYRMKVARFLPWFMIDDETRQPTSRSDVPNNPALELVLIKGETGEEQSHWVFANHPDFSHGQKLPGDAKITFTYIPALPDKPAYIISADSRFVKVENGNVVDRGSLEDNRLDFGDYAFTFKRFIPHATKKREEYNRSEEFENPVVMITWTRNNRSESYSLAASSERATFLDNGRVALLLRNKETSPKAYRSHVSVLEDGKPVKQHTLVVNSPLIHGGYYFYQSNYDPKDPTYSGIMVVRDPGVYIVFFGFFLLVAGGILRFYFKM